MSVRYITVTPITNLFKPVTRSFGDIAIVGAADSEAGGPKKIPIAITNPDNVSSISNTNLASAITDTATTITVTTTTGFPNAPFTIQIDEEFMTVTAVATTTWTVTRGVAGTSGKAHTNGAGVFYPAKNQPVDSFVWFKGDLGKSVRKAFEQEPGPTVVWAVRTNPTENNTSEPAKAIENALIEVVAKLNVQIVVLANTPLKSATEGQPQIEALASHVSTVSNTGGDGKERIGIAMLDRTITSQSVITGKMSIDRMVMIAHKSKEDAAAAVAGTIAGYEPHISLLLKPVKIGMDELFSDSEIDVFNATNDPDLPRVNWLTDPTLLPGKGLYMGEGYTLGAARPYIDIVRTIDDISFRLKAALIVSIGNLRVSRSGLRALVSQMTAILEPLRQREVIEAFDVFIPLLVLLDKPPGTLTDAELQQINNAQNTRVVDAIISVDYAGAIHRLNITLKFE